MAASPQFITTAALGQVLLTTANANRDGTGTIGTVLTAGASGSEVWWVRIKARGATTAGMIRLFLHDGTTYRGLLTEVAVEARTPSATVPSVEYTVPLLMPVTGETTSPLVLPNLWSLRAATEKGEQFDVIAVGGNY